MQRINAASIGEMFTGSGAEIYRRAEECIHTHGMDKMIKQGVLLGLSGGADSVMLLCFLLEYRKRSDCDFPILAVHVNHSIRGDEADYDEQFSCRLCQDLSVEFLSFKRDVPTAAEEANVGLEEAAREARYSIFADIIRSRNDISTIAVAHNMSDNAETVLFNIFRGTGARGASGIRSTRDQIIRPLIDISKAEILDVLSKANIPFVTDRTNLSDDYSRNYIRNQVVPTLRKVCSDPEKMLSRFAANLRSDDDFISSVARDFIVSHKTITNSDLASLHYSVFVRVLALMSGYEYGYLSSAVTRDIYGLLCKDNFSYSLFGDNKFICERGVCRVDKPDCEVDYSIPLCDEVTYVEEYNADFILSAKRVEKTSLIVYKNSIQANLSSAIIDGDLYLRPKKDGDTVYYGGMTHKVKKLFSDKKIPLSERKRLPLLCDKRGVVWVPGFGVRDDKPTEEERRDLFAILATKE